MVCSMEGLKKCMLAKMEILEKTRGIEVKGIIQKDLANKWCAPKVRTEIKREIEISKLLIFGQEEDHISAKGIGGKGRNTD